MDQIVDILLVEDRIEDAELAQMGLKKHNLINNIVWVKDGGRSPGVPIGQRSLCRSQQGK